LLPQAFVFKKKEVIIKVVLFFLGSLEALLGLLAFLIPQLSLPL